MCLSLKKRKYNRPKKVAFMNYYKANIHKKIQIKK